MVLPRVHECRGVSRLDDAVLDGRALVIDGLGSLARDVERCARLNVVVEEHGHDAARVEHVATYCDDLRRCFRSRGALAVPEAELGRRIGGVCVVSAIDPPATVARVQRGRVDEH